MQVHRSGWPLRFEHSLALSGGLGAVAFIHLVAVGCLRCWLGTISFTLQQWFSHSNEARNYPKLHCWVLGLEPYCGPPMHGLDIRTILTSIIEAPTC